MGQGGYNAANVFKIRDITIILWRYPELTLECSFITLMKY